MWNFWSVYPMFITNWRSMSVYMYMFAQMPHLDCTFVSLRVCATSDPCGCMCVCVCHRAPSASTKQCRRVRCLSSLLFCGCYSLPHFLFSLPFCDSELGLCSSSGITSLLPLQAAGSSATIGIKRLTFMQIGGGGGCVRCKEDKIVLCFLRECD